MRTHATSCIGETGLKIFNGFLIFFNGFPIFLNGFPIFLNNFSLSKKSEKIYLRREVYKRSLFELCIFCHSLSHSRSELRNTPYNTHHSQSFWASCRIISSSIVLDVTSSGSSSFIVLMIQSLGSSQSFWDRCIINSSSIDLESQPPVDLHSLS